MFIDEARIRIKAGDGGNGCMAFRREKFVPRGGPSGGDGGHGGDILMRSSLSHNTLVHFRFNPEHKSERGGHGLGSNMSGAQGHVTTLKVPVGTLLWDDDTGELIHDFARPNEEIVIARGGRGGRGNQHFATSTHQAPREHELGRPGEARNYRLELRLLADAGLVGFPNVGKSTLISRLSAAKPKIANYAFTTLEPNLGVVQVGDFPYEKSFTVADMPGLIEGAHLGAGLGVQFLKHIERTSVLVHLVDVSDTAIVPEGMTYTPTEAGTPSVPLHGTAGSSVLTEADEGAPASLTGRDEGAHASLTGADEGAPASLTGADEGAPASLTGADERAHASLTGGDEGFSLRNKGKKKKGFSPGAATDQTPDPVLNYNIITNELKSFDPALAAKPTLLVASKVDVANPEKLKKLRAMAKRKKLPFYEISPVTGEGIDTLKYAIADAVALHRAIPMASEALATSRPEQLSSFDEVGGSASKAATNPTGTPPPQPTPDNIYVRSKKHKSPFAPPAANSRGSRTR